MADTPNLFAKAKVQLVLNSPFFGVLVCHLPTEPLDGAIMMAMGAPPTAMVDGKKIYYNPEWVKTLTDKQRIGLLCHEVLHPALQHLWRRGQREPELWNQACDYVVNSVIMGTKTTQGTGYELPPEGLLDKRFDGMAVEQVYHHLKEEQKQDKKRPGKGGKVMDGHLEREYGKGKGQPGQGKAKGTGAGEEKKGQGGGGKGKDEKKGKGAGKDQGKPQDGEEEGQNDSGEGEEGDGEGQGQGQNGSDQLPSNVQQPGQGGSPDSNVGALDDADGSLEEVWRGLLTQAAMVAKQRGTLPGQLERLVEAATQPRVPWQRIIEMYINDVVRDDYDMLRQDRRFLQQGIYLPELQSNACQVAVAVDTSGSIGAEELKTFLGEITGMLRCRGVSRMRLLACDAEVTLDETILPTDPLPENFPGGGGTDFRGPFKRVLEDEPEGMPPALFIYLTDLMGTFPEHDPGVPTIWLGVYRPGTDPDSLPQPPFGVLVPLELDDIGP